MAMISDIWKKTPELPVRKKELRSAIEYAHESGRFDGVLAMAEDQQRALTCWQGRIEKLIGAVEELKEKNRELSEENERLKSRNEAFSPLM